MGSDQISRRHFLRLFSAFGISGAFGAGFGTLEAHHFEVERVEIRLARLPETFEGFKIAQLSDLHYNHYLGENYFARVVDAINALGPDMVALTGDFLTGTRMPWTFVAGGRPKQQAEPCATSLARLQAPFGRFASLGNHDLVVAPRLLTEVFHQHGLRMLTNESIPVEREGARLWIVGLPSLSPYTRLEETLSQIPKEECKLLLMHEPDFADLVVRQQSVDFQMSGHSHGGQIRFPLIGAPVLPHNARRYPAGLYQVGNMHLYTTRGVGVVDLPFRLNCPPEVTLFTLRKETSLRG